MSESTYTQYFHKKLKEKGVYCLKLNLVHSSGVADSYFSGNKGDMWVEFKYIKELPKRPGTKVPINLSRLQQHWIEGRVNEGRNVYIIIGSPRDNLLLHGSQLNEEVTMERFRIESSTRLEIIKWISNKIID